MCASRSKTIHLPSGEISTDIQVPSEVSKSISRAVPRGSVVSHLSSGLSFGLSVPSACANALRESDANERTRSKNMPKTRGIRVIKIAPEVIRKDKLRRLCRLPAIGTGACGGMIHGGDRLH